MENISSDEELYLLVDIDDLLVRSSDKLQEVLNTKTNFKTDVLRMLEQLNRNCKYFMEQVKRECEFAKNEGEKPNLSRFQIFKNVKFNSQNEWYSKPVDACAYYLKVANAILNQFLEERDTFLEIDNMPEGEIKKFNSEKEHEAIIKYRELIDNNKDAFHMINSFCLKRAEDLITSATIRNMMSSSKSLVIPDYGALVSMDTNDIIKGNSLSKSNNQLNQEYILYEKPLNDIKNCMELENHLYDIIINARVFTTPSKEIVDYRSIHSEANVNWKAVALVEELIHSKLFKGVYFSTHHNGDREEKAKISLMKRLIPEANGFIGQRFHDTEHDSVRRLRSSKIDRASEYLMIDPCQIVLLDDSKANCGDCKSKGGTEVLYKPETDSEIINGKLEDTGYNRILMFNNNHVYGFIAEAYIKQKTKIKK